MIMSQSHELDNFRVGRGRLTDSTVSVHESTVVSYHTDIQSLGHARHYASVAPRPGRKTVSISIE